MMQLRAAILVAGLLLVGVPGYAQGPQSWDSKRVQVTRSDLSELLAQYEQLLESKSHSGHFKARIRSEADAIRERLEHGDIQVGDQIVLFVEGQRELSDTFTVRAGQVLFVPNVGDIPVAGLLRSELQDRISEHMGRYVVNPVVRVRPLIRIMVAGEVGRPGYYVVPTESLMTDVLMLAGGPNSQAAIDKLRVERQGTRRHEGEALQKAITEGRTLDQMNFHPGDQIFLPRNERRGMSFGVVAQAITATVSIIGLLAAAL